MGSSHARAAVPGGDAFHLGSAGHLHPLRGRSAVLAHRTPFRPGARRPTGVLREGETAKRSAVQVARKLGWANDRYSAGKVRGVASEEGRAKECQGAGR